MNYTHNILKTTVDINTGLILDQVKYSQKSKTKGGWSKMYHKSYTEMQELCIKGVSDLKVWNYIIANTKPDFSVSINVTKLSKSINTTRTTVHSFITRALTNQFIRKEDGEYMVNPFIHIPYGCNDELSSLAQERWKA